MSMSACDALVLFGASGDLAERKIFPALQALIRRNSLDVPVIGVGFSGWSVEQLRERVQHSLQTHGDGIDAAATRLLGLLSYVDGDYREAATHRSLRSALDGAQHPLHYLAVPPSLFPTVVGGLGSMAGQILSAIVFTFLPEKLQVFAQYQFIVYGLILAFSLILLPRGLA
ncbi:MAG TPA: hypothetical protein PKC08_11780, partial [Pseudomonadales bacterium]|nr:hypothetical protein [Pseudomonadales bacterium]